MMESSIPAKPIRNYDLTCWPLWFRLISLQANDHDAFNFNIDAQNK